MLIKGSLLPRVPRSQRRKQMAGNFSCQRHARVITLVLPKNMSRTDEVESSRIVVLAGYGLLVSSYVYSNVYLLNNHMIRSYLISYVHSYYMFNVRSFMIGAGPAKAAAAPIQADLVKGTRLRLSSCAKVPADGSN